MGPEILARQFSGAKLADLIDAVHAFLPYSRACLIFRNCSDFDSYIYGSIAPLFASSLRPFLKWDQMSAANAVALHFLSYVSFCDKD